MATARKVDEVTKVVTPAKVVLELTPDEAATLLNIMGKVYGNSMHSYAIYDALLGVDVGISDNVEYRYNNVLNAIRLYIGSR